MNIIRVTLNVDALLPSSTWPSHAWRAWYGHISQTAGLTRAKDFQRRWNCGTKLMRCVVASQLDRIVKGKTDVMRVCRRFAGVV